MEQVKLLKKTNFQERNPAKFYQQKGLWSNKKFKLNSLKKKNSRSKCQVLVVKLIGRPFTKDKQKRIKTWTWSLTWWSKQFQHLMTLKWKYQSSINYWMTKMLICRRKRCKSNARTIYDNILIKLYCNLILIWISLRVVRII